MGGAGELVRQGLAVVDAVAKRLARRLSGCVDVDDLRSMGHVALLDVARSYDRERADFAAYAAWRLKWAMIDGVRRETHGRAQAARVLAVMASERFGEGAEPEPEGPTTEEQDEAALSALLAGHAAALALGLCAARPPGAAANDDPEEQLCRAQTRGRMRDAVSGLPERERLLIERHYFGDEAFESIASDLGISKSRASRLHHRAIAALYESLKE